MASFAATAEKVRFSSENQNNHLKLPKKYESILKENDTEWSWFLWEVPGFLSKVTAATKEGLGKFEFIQSSQTFYRGQHIKKPSKWYLRLKHSKDKKYAGYVGIWLYLEKILEQSDDFQQDSIYAMNSRVFVLGTNNEVLNEIANCTTGAHEFKMHFGYGWDTFIHAPSVITQKEKYLHGGDTLKIYFGHRIYSSGESAKDTGITEIERPFGISPISNLFQSTKYSDVNIEIENKIIPAHINILSVQSPVFASMFDKCISEKLISKPFVRIKDVRVQEFLAILEHCYTGVIPEVNWTMNLSLVERFIRAADYYQMDVLKNAWCIQLIDTFKIKQFGKLAKIILTNNSDERITLILRKLFLENQEIFLKLGEIKDILQDQELLSKLMLNR